MEMMGMNRARNAALAALLALGLMFPTTGIAAAEGQDDAEEDSAAKASLDEMFKDETSDEDVPTKTETVYVYANADGSVKRTVVTAWLNNVLGDAELHDVSTLSDIQNTEGEQTYELQGDGLVWDAQGADIYYQGTSDLTVPVQMKVTYWLDGEEMSADKMAGKSGHVKLRFEFANTLSSTEYVDGAARTVYTPFVCVTGMVLDNGIFKNVKTVNARVLNDGDRTLVGGYAMPGMQENLGLDKEDADLPDYFEIEADVEGFEMGATATMISNSFLDSLDVDELDTSELGNSLEQLSGAMGQLVDGTSGLYSGLVKLDKGSSQLSEGLGSFKGGLLELAKAVNSLATGAGDLASGTSDLKDGTESLAQGAAVLAKGAQEESDGAAAVADGADALKDGSGALAEKTGEMAKGAADVKEGADTVDAVVAMLETAAGETSAAAGTLLDDVSQLNGDVTKAAGSAGQAADEASGLAAIVEEQGAGLSDVSADIELAVEELSKIDVEGLSAEEADALQRALAGLESASGSTSALSSSNQDIATSLGEMALSLNEARANVDGVAEGLQQAEKDANQLGGALDELVADAQQLSSAASGLASGAGDLSNGAQQLSEGMEGLSQSAADLAEGTRQVSGGAQEITDGVDSLAEGAGSVNKGAAALSTGAEALEGGLTGLDNGIPELTAGIAALKGGSSRLASGLHAATQGAGKLKTGISQLDDEGIQRMLDAYDDNVEGLASRLRATVEAGKRYDTFSGKSDSMRGSVKFVYETGPIEVEG